MSWVAGFALAACDDEYPLEPTFCDDWCHATLRADCGDEPDNCVRECELTKSDDECLSKQRKLMQCYESASDEAFTCAGTGFQFETRVSPTTCEAERDALFECEAPGIGVCLSFCRTTQQRQLGAIVDSDTGLVDFSRLSESDAGVGADCPALDQPCDQLCWSVFSFTSLGLAAAGVGVEDTAVGAPAVDAGLAGATALECVQLSLLGCLAEATDNPVEADAGARARRRSIGDVITQCTGEEFAAR
jgi:hypothetical protein